MPEDGEEQKIFETEKVKIVRIPGSPSPFYDFYIYNVDKFRIPEVIMERLLKALRYVDEDTLEEWKEGDEDDEKNN